MEIPAEDRTVLRELGRRLAEVAALPVHKEKAALWTKLNQLEKVRPLVWINEIPWHEMNVNDELTLRCKTPWARGIESSLRMQLYQWRHMPADMILSDYIACPIVWRTTGFGITQQGEWLQTERGSVASQRFTPQISSLGDLEKIKMPVVSVDWVETEARLAALCEVFDGIMPVRKQGVKNYWYTPWDNLIRWWGVHEAMMDLVEKPDLVNAAVSRVVDAYMAELDQMEKMNLLTLNNDNTRIGSGGYGYTSELPGKDYDPLHVRPHNMWGCSNAQIFVTVSPEMHWEFAIRHDLRWLKRWGLTYYGCCEPLDTKLDILRRIPNLRKVSMSPWVDVERAVKGVGTDLVFSYKPSPAILAEDRWRPEQVRADLRAVLEKARGCHVEVILKDISTVRHEPQRLWEWAKIAMEVVEEFVP